MTDVVARAARLRGGPESLARFAAARLAGRVAGVWLTDATPDERAALARHVALVEPPARTQVAPIAAALAGADARLIGDWARGQPAEPGAWLVTDHPAVAAFMAGLGGRTAERASAAFAGCLLALPGVAVLPLSLLAGQLRAGDDIDASRWAAAEDDGPSNQTRVGDAVERLLRVRATLPGFAAGGACQIPDAGQGVLLVIRDAPDGDGTPMGAQRGRVVCITNLTGEECLVSPDWRALLGTRNAIRDQVTGVRFNVHGPSLGLAPWQVVWATV
ncbi:MAG: hypothetical protein KA750_08780 [Thermoflexales bacterium]|nr:hypothetical protein [Thermoflexales bacterium]